MRFFFSIFFSSSIKNRSVVVDYQEEELITDGRF